jgi:hypothetical protein
VKIKHHEREIELPDDWWAEAGMADFVPSTNAYRVYPASEIFTVSIENVGLVTRPEVFKDSEDSGTAHSRVLKILCGFRLGEAIPPVEVVGAKPEYGHRFKLTYGAHRFHCSLAAGFTHVPAITGDHNDRFA